MKDILAIDIGTTTFKMGIFSPDLRIKCEASRDYEVNLYDQGKADIEPEKWWHALKSCCLELKPFLKNVHVVSFSVTTPGLVPMSEDGTALGPAILFFDRRSQKQAAEIRDRVGEERFLKIACNLPVTGGSSLCSIIWIRENQPEVWEAAEKFGHTNTYMVKRFTGNWIIDPSTISITGLYNTQKNDLSWNNEVLEKAELPASKLPELMHSYQKAGTILPDIADELGLPKACVVLCGGNDAVLAGLSAGLREPGEIVDIAGTCEIISVCLDRPYGSPNYNIRCHVIPDRWVTLFVLNTGGKALEWFHSVFCQDMDKNTFFNIYLPEVIQQFIQSANIDRLEKELPIYTPYLQGSRYSLKPLTAGFDGLNLEINREKFLLGLLKGNLQYLGGHLKEVSQFLSLKKEIITTGGGAKIKGMNELKKMWTGDFTYKYQDQSSLLGAAMLGNFYQTKQFI